MPLANLGTPWDQVKVSTTVVDRKMHFMERYRLFIQNQFVYIINQSQTELYGRHNNLAKTFIVFGRYLIYYVFLVKLI